MTIKSNLNNLLEHLITTKHKESSNQQLISCLDLTLLNETATKDDLITLNEQAKANGVAAICVYPHQLHYFSNLTDNAKATVINFPHGTDSIKKCLHAIEQSHHHYANEIDYVFPYQDYLAGNEKLAFDHAKMIAKYCQTHHLRLKVILETGAFSSMESLYTMSRTLIDMGYDFLKTSTGKIHQGASLTDALTLLSAIKDGGDHCGIKLSGGIKTPRQAYNYVYLAEHLLEKKINNSWFRIGASSLLDELIKS